MGLDMFLNKRTYVKDYDVSVISKKDGQQAGHIQPTRIYYIIEEVMYWRKANAIHNWFVQKCQKGIDVCQETEIYREKLEELLALCSKVLSKPEGKQRDKYATKHLPPTSGFFFGPTEIGNGYYQDLEDTRDAISKLLKDNTPDDYTVSYYYNASW